MERYKVKSFYCEEIAQEFLNEFSERFRIKKLYFQVFNECITLIISYEEV